jgi:hypothetical protein
MVGVDAKPVPTDMMNVMVTRYWSNEKFIGNPVGISTLPIKKEPSVPISADAGIKIPTIVWPSFADFIKKSFGNCLVFHAVNIAC